MKKAIRFVCALIVCALIAAFVRFIQVSGFSGAGGGTDSPDKKFIAEAMSIEGEKFWGGKFAYYEFTIKGTNGAVIRHCKLEDPPLPLSDWYNESQQLIIWATNNSSVTYHFNGGHLS